MESVALLFVFICRYSSPMYVRWCVFCMKTRLGGDVLPGLWFARNRPQQPWESMEITGSGMLRPSDTSHSVSTQQRPVNGLLGASMTSDYCTDPPFYRRIGFGVETVNHEELAASPHRRPHCLRSFCRCPSMAAVLRGRLQSFEISCRQSPLPLPASPSCDHGGKEFKPCNFMSTL